MNPSDFLAEAPGRLIRARGGYFAFVPDPLPPALTASWSMSSAISEAERSLAHLGRVLTGLPSAELLVAPFVRREAVLSSRIEGTRASLAELLEVEAGRAEREGSDVREVANYVAALNHGIKRLQTLPMSLRFIRELHALLLKGAGGHLTPGEFRHTQSWIGNPGSTLATSTFVPPPPEEMLRALADLESFLHAPSELPALVRLGLIHYQFETIHPFLDGNGRIGRLLVTILLRADGLVPAPVPYFSAFIDRRRTDYYRLLLSVSQRRDWVAWLEFFLSALATEARDAARRGEALLELRSRHRAVVGGSRATRTLEAGIDLLFSAPIQTIASLRHSLGVSNRTAQLTAARLVELGLLEESTGRRRGRMFVAREILELLEAETF
ncbi:MAG: Fic family protein [Dehalococcoidia bacterium]